MALSEHRLWWLMVCLLVAFLLCAVMADRPPVFAADCVAGPHSGTLVSSQDWCLNTTRMC